MCFMYMINKKDTKKNPKNRKRYIKYPQITIKNKKSLVVSNKIYEGGKADLNLAYTYFSVDNVFLKNNPALAKWIYYNQQLCNCRADNKDPCNIDNNIPANLLNDNSVFLMVIKFDTLQNFLVSKLDINNNAEHFDLFTENILGFCLLGGVTHNDNNIVFIYDVCLTDMKRKGYGKTLFSVIMTFLELKYNELDPLLWLGIKLSNKEFNKVCNIYTAFGFKDPYISSEDLFGNNLGFNILALSKQLSYYVNIQKSTELVYNKCLFMKDAYINRYAMYKTDDTIYVSKINIKLDPSCLLKLKLLPYITKDGITEIRDPGSPDANHLEHSGSLTMINNYYNTDFTGVFSFETYGVNRPFILTHGEQEQVSIDYRPYTYHSHPIAVYVKYNVCIATPSSPDLLWYISSYINDYKNYEADTYCIYHLVTTVEGLYCISIHPDLVVSLHELILDIKSDSTEYDRLFNHIQNNLEYPFSERYYDFNDMFYDYPDQNRFDPALVAQNLDKYFKWFESENIYTLKNGKQINLFNLEFKFWKTLFINDPKIQPFHFDINLPIVYNNSFISAEDYKIIPLLHNKQLLNYIENNAFNILM
jgi:hypothetical protein